MNEEVPSSTAEFLAELVMRDPIILPTIEGCIGSHHSLMAMIKTEIRRRLPGGGEVVQDMVHAIHVGRRQRGYRVSEHNT